jgi:SIR2-like domain
VRRIARRIYAEKVKGGALVPEQVKLSEWQSWLQEQPWFIKDEQHLAENFPFAVEHLLKPREYRSRILRDLFQPTNGIGPGYRHLAGLVMKGLVRTILTANFDTALPAALNERRPHIPHIAEVNRNPADLREFGLFNRAQIVWLHGKAEQYTDKNVTDETDKLDRALVEQLVPLLANSPLIVLGYRGSEASIMDHLLAKNAKRALDFKNRIFWCIRAGEKPHRNVAALQADLGGNFHLLEITGFDEVMEDLARELADEDLYPTARATERGGRPLAFDDREVPGATVSDLDHDLMLTVMRDYCSKLGRPTVTHDTLYGLLREQGLLVTIDGEERPTAGCVLLFSKDPQQFFPHAQISVTISGKKRTLFGRNLIVQRKALLEWLESEDVNPPLKVKRRSKHDPSPAYPGRALVELVINLLVHRDYERTAIDVEPGRAITFKNSFQTKRAIGGTDVRTARQWRAHGGRADRGVHEQGAALASDC